MKKPIVASVAALILSSVVLCLAQETSPMPVMPAPEKQHEWLQQMVGEWDNHASVTMEPGQAPIESQGMETVRSIGGFWVISEIQGICPMDGSPFTGVMTLGYDPAKQKFIGTWIDSMSSYLWNYEGTLDAAGKILTLEAEGPNPMNPGESSKFREEIEFKNKDERTFTSSIQGEDGQWIKMMTAICRRK